MFAISVEGDLENDGSSSVFELKQPIRDPKHLAQILEEANCVGIVGQNGIIGRKTSRSNFKNPTPTFGNRLIPHRIASAWPELRSKIGMVFGYLEALPIRNIHFQPFRNVDNRLRRCGDDNALDNVQPQICVI